MPLRCLFAVAPLLVIAGAAVAVPSAGAAAEPPLTISNTSAATVTTATSLEADHKYSLTVSGTVSDWCPDSAVAPTDCSERSPLVKAAGVDPVYCYAAWRRCQPPVPWQQLRVNGRGVLEFAGLTPAQMPYNDAHRYIIEFSGISGQLTLGSSDALAGSTSDNSGSFTAALADLGPVGGGRGTGTGTGTSPGTAFKLLRIKDTPEYRTFHGLDDPALDSFHGLARRHRYGLAVADTALEYPGVTIDASIPGEDSGGAHSPALLYPNNDLFRLLALDTPPASLFGSGNVYARASGRFEGELRRRILASGGTLTPAAVLRLALDAVKQGSGVASYPLAVLTAHNLLKNVTKIGRAAIDDAAGVPDPPHLTAASAALHNAKVAKELAVLRRLTPIVAKLASLRASPGTSKDKMGPWYHAFAVLTVGALLDGRSARLVVLAEHGGKYMRLFHGEGGFDREKFELDAAWSAAAVHISAEGLVRPPSG